MCGGGDEGGVGEGCCVHEVGCEGAGLDYYDADVEGGEFAGEGF